MKKLLLSLSTITLLTAPLATVVACAAKSDDATPETPPVGGGDSDDGSGDGGSGGGDSGDGGTTPTDPPIMTEAEIEEYLAKRSFAIISSNSLYKPTSMGSGWLIDESEDNWYVATNRHVTAAIKQNDTVTVTNDWDRMHEDYDIRNHPYDLYTSGVTPDEAVVNPMTESEITVLFNDLRQTSPVGEVMFEKVDPNEGNTGAAAVDYFDFAIIKVPKIGSNIDADATPINIAGSDYMTKYHRDQYGSLWTRGYSYANGNYRFGSFFHNTFVNSYNNFNTKAWSPSWYQIPAGETEKSNWGFDNGPGSSGSALVDNRGYFMMSNTFGYESPGIPIYESEAKNNYKFHHSGVNGQGFFDTILPLYQSALNEATHLHPTWS